jgi:hypothetical protein
MKKIIALLGVVGSIALASGTAHAALSPAAKSMLQSQLRLQTQRANELQVVVNRDQQALNDVGNDITTLTNHQNAMNQGATDFKNLAADPSACAITSPNLTQTQCVAALNRWASEYALWATHDGELIAHQTTIKTELAAALATEKAWLAWHRNFIADLQAKLNAS